MPICTNILKGVQGWAGKLFSKTKKKNITKKEKDMKHAILLPTETTLCGLPSNDKRAGWIFNSIGMKLRKGQQYSLFQESVSCPSCLYAGKELIDETCPTCHGTIEE